MSLSGTTVQPSVPTLDFVSFLSKILYYYLPLLEALMRVSFDKEYSTNTGHGNAKAIERSLGSADVFTRCQYFADIVTAKIPVNIS
jgi:hypothetical protein